MMRSLFSGVSGLKSHQTRMDVIGNNIANVNTTGYKSKSLNFSDMLYQTTQAASGPNASAKTGGINPRQIGLGVKTAAINTSITTEGATQSTGNPFDLKLTGEAFFVVSDGTNTYYTRDGSFDVDEAGNLCMASTGYIVQGWKVDEEGNIMKGSLGDLNVLSQSTYEAAATTSAKISKILDKNDTDLQTTNGKRLNIQVFDALGYEYNVQFGILPKTSISAATREIDNTETEYSLEDKIYQVDTSKLSYNIAGRELESVSNPKELIDALDEAVWGYVNGTANGDRVGSVTVAGFQTGSAHVFGEKEEGSITIKMDEFLKANKTLATSVLNYSDLSTAELKVNFSGGSGFTVTFTGYPLKDVSTVDIKPATLTGLYEASSGDDKNGGKAYKLKSTDVKTVTSTRQTYTGADGSTQTNYTFKTGPAGTAGNPAQGTPLTVTDASALQKLLAAIGDKNENVVNTYKTSEADPKPIETPIDGEYTISLIGMVDSEGKSVEGINALIGDNSTWDLIYNKADGKFSYVDTAGSESFTLALSGIGNGNFSDLTVNMKDTTNEGNGGKSTLTGLKDDGRKVGTMSGVAIGNDGIITANYSNGMSRVLGQICVGTFANSMGLENAGDSLYSMTANSGDCVYEDIKASGIGYMTTGVLEMSNVDLSQEFTTMITTQRGFQANSRIITVSDTLLEELTNLKR